MCPDVLEALKNVMQSFINDEQTSPLHVGEVMSCWTVLALVAETQVQVEVGINSTTDTELRETFQEAIKMFKFQKEELTSFMRAQGISLPPMSEPKPISDPNQVPLGVKLTDIELANSLKKKMSLLITDCANTAAQSLRNDVSILWVKFIQEYISFFINLKALMKKRGWLKVAPYYNPPGLLNKGR